MPQDFKVLDANGNEIANDDESDWEKCENGVKTTQLVWIYCILKTDTDISLALITLKL